MLLSEAFEEQGTAIRTMWAYFWEEEEEIIQTAYGIFGQ